MSIKTLISTTALIAGMTAIAPTTQAADWTLSTDFVGEYVFRGQTFGAESVQPAVEVSLENGLTLGIWGSTGVGEQSDDNGDEIDFYAAYSLPLSDTFTLDLGATYYHYPQGGDLLETEDGAVGSYEFSAGTSFDAPFGPSLTAYYDTTLENFTLEGGLGHSIAAGPKGSFDLGAALGYVDLGNDGTIGGSEAVTIGSLANSFFDGGTTVAEIEALLDGLTLSAADQALIDAIDLNNPALADVNAAADVLLAPAVAGDAFDSYTYGSISAAYSYAFSDAASGYIGVTAVASSEDTLADTEDSSPESSTVYYSIGLSTGF